jgi:hypothetical protein
VLRVALFINSGAVATLMAFAGNMLKQSNVLAVRSLFSTSLAYFEYGILAAVIAIGTNYLALLSYTWENYIPGDILTVVAIGSVLVSYGTFWWGTREAVHAVLKALAS